MNLPNTTTVRVETSADPHLLLWNCEAEYKYYRHGPLAQIIIGDSLQTMNYYYTLQGWLKGVNDPLLRTNPTKKIQDLYGYSLHYFEGDYKPIAQILVPPMPTAPTQEVQQTGKNLYNGNIRSMITGIAGISQPTQAMTYQYDQLNRLTATISHSWDKAAGSFAANNLYNSQYTYDANGNISTLKRNAPKSATILEPTPMDDLTYSYYNKNAGYSRHTNRLSSVTDAITEALYDDEFTAGQAANNYSYDATGNLIADAHEEIEEIRWNVQGKVVYLKRTESSNKPDIEFEYDAMGNRIAKHVKPKNSATHSTYYVRDAQGNTMATYTNAQTNGTETITLEEQPIYGSSRIGVYSPTADTGIVRGLRTYEATNHLGNVLTTYTDRIILSEDFTYTPEQTTATDYYPFGMPMPGRSFSVGNYRYGFNGQEKINEVYGFGNLNIAEFWLYDTRLARRWNRDPVVKYHESSFAAFANNPIWFVDPIGRDTTVFNEMGEIIKNLTGDNGATNIWYVTKTTLSTDQMYPSDVIYAINKDNTSTKGYSDPISTQDYENTVMEVQNGNFSPEVMANLVQIPNKEMGQFILTELIKDNRKGGTDPANNREYSFFMLIEYFPFYGRYLEGPLGNPADGKALGTGQGATTDHSHPSGTNGSASWMQPPSSNDIKNSYDIRERRVWSMGIEKLYIINTQGVQATVPLLIYE